jgi:hypothetical protein
MFSISLKRSVAALAVTAGLLAAAAPANADSTKYTMLSPDGVASSEVFELNTFGGNDTLRADSNEVAVEGITQIREPAHTVTCLDQDLNSVRANACVVGIIEGND